jgi:signal transduction histidine kinase
VSLLHTQDDVSIFPIIQKAVRKKKEGFNGEITLVRKTGETFPALFTVKPLYNKDGKVTASMGISVDISELKLAQQLQIENKSLEEINRLKNEFMANMSHELRTPLNSIIGFSELMMSEQFGELNKKQQKHIKNIHYNGQSLLSLINDVLDISKIESGKLEINYERIKLDDILKDIEISFQPLIKIKKQKLEIIAEKEIFLRTDPIRIKQCINNILSNAIKYTQKNGKIVITAIKKGNIIEFSIKDNGIGIPSKKITDVFKPFFKISTTDTVYDSAGLGLNITKTIIETMKGQIWVESEEGKGSTFFFNIPAN